MSDTDRPRSPFAGMTDFAVGILPVSVAIGDFDADGAQDVAIATGGAPPDFNGNVCAAPGCGRCYHLQRDHSLTPLPTEG